MGKASDLFVECLVNEGVKYVIGIPGEENLDVLDSIRQHKDIEILITRHEQAAAFMAATIGRLTGKPGVALSTLGPGALNLLTGAAYANLGAFPMIMITGQKPIHHSKQGAFQIIDNIAVMEPVTKYAKQIIAGSQIPSLTREAFRVAMQERPGACHLELPEDVAAHVVDESVRPFRIQTARRPVAEMKAISQAIQMIQESKCPLILVGAAANRKLTAKMLTQFVDKTKIYFFTTQMGKGVISDSHPQCLGTAALSSGDYIHDVVSAADLIINIGHDVVEKPPFIMKRTNPQKVIHVNFFSAQLDEVYFPDLDVVGDIANAVWQLCEGVEVQEVWGQQGLAEKKRKIDGHVGEKADDASFPIIPQRLVSSTRKVVPDSGIICLDNGMYKLWFARNYPALEPNTILLDNALATMGAGLPSAMGTRLVYPSLADRKIVAICGDGGFMMNSQELETCVRCKLDITVVILNDGGYGMIKWKQEGMELPIYGLDFGNPDFKKYAESYGANGYRITSVQDYEDTLKHCLDTPGVHLIDLPVNYGPNKHVLIDEIRGRQTL